MDSVFAISVSLPLIFLIPKNPHVYLGLYQQFMNLIFKQQSMHCSLVRSLSQFSKCNQHPKSISVFFFRFGSLFRKNIMLYYFRRESIFVLKNTTATWEAHKHLKYAQKW